MKAQPAFDFHWEPPSAPFQGSCATAIQASKSGAVYATKARSAKIQALLQLWKEPRTMNEIQAITQWPLSSVCSLKDCIADQLVAVDQETVTWDDGRTTQRTRWSVKP